MHHLKSLFTTVILLPLATFTFPPAATGASTPALVSSSLNSITPGIPWADSSGNLIQGHNGSVIYYTNPVTHKSAYYWIGQDMSNGARDGVACYSSTNLVHWTKIQGTYNNPQGTYDNTQGNILSVNGLLPPDNWEGAAPMYLMGSPKVIQEPGSSEFVLWAAVSVQSDTFPRPAIDFLVDVATSSSPCGDYTWQRDAPFYPFDKYPSGDIGLFQIGSNVFLFSEDQGGYVCTPSSPGPVNVNCYVFKGCTRR